VFELVEEPLDEVAFLVKFGVTGSLHFTVPLGRDDDLSSCFFYLFNKMISVIALVAQQGIGIDAVDKIMGEGDIVALSGRADQAEGKAKCICGGMDFRA